MKFSTTPMSIFYLEDLKIINVKHDQEITSYSGNGSNIRVDGIDFSRFRTADKFFYMTDKEERNVQIPGSSLMLTNRRYYAVPKNPEEDEWDLQTLWIIINTANLKSRLNKLLPELDMLKIQLASKGVNILDANGNRSIADVIEKPLAKLIKQLEELNEATALNFKP